MRALALAMVLAMWSSIAAAQAGQPAPGDDQRARLHFQAGQSYYDSGEYEDALREFTRAYELSQKPELFYNISLCHQSLGDYEQAASFLQRYLSEASEIPNRSSLEARLENFRRRAQDAEATPEPETQEPVTEPPTPTTTREPEPAPTPTDTSASGPGAGPYVVLGVGGAGLLTAGIFGILALSEESSVSDGCGATVSCTSDEVSSMDTLALISDIGLVVGVIGVGAGLTWLLVGSSDGESETASLRVSPWASTHSAGATASGRF